VAVTVPTAPPWRFTDIRADAFHWIGETLKPDGATWMLQGEFQAQRRSSA
jgi:hypothetical protein